jgi:hypothetical protein
MAKQINPHDAPEVFPRIAAQSEAFTRRGQPAYAADWIFNAAYRCKRSGHSDTPEGIAAALRDVAEPHAAAIRDLLDNWDPQADVPHVLNPSDPTPRPTPEQWAAHKNIRARARQHNPTHQPL